MNKRNGNMWTLGVFFLGIQAISASTAFAVPPSKAEEMFLTGSFSDAQSAFQQQAKSEPTNAHAFQRLGQIALLQNELATAQANLQRALELDAENKDAKKLLAETYYRQDDFSVAAKLYRELNQTAMADKLASFEGKTPYKTSGGEFTRVKFVLTDPLPLIQMRINDSDPVNVIIDTGGSELIVDTEFAAKIGAKLFGTQSGTYGGGKKGDFQHGCVDKIQLGDFTVENVPIHVMSTRRFAAAAAGKRVDGVLGTVFLYQFLPTLDYPGGALLLARKTEAARKSLDARFAKSTAESVPFWTAGDHLILAEGRVNDKHSALMLIDTGLAGGGFTCPKSTVDAAGLDIKGQSFQGVGGGGAVTVTPFFAKKLALGHVVKKEVMSFYGPFPESLERKFGFRIGGLYSHNFFRDHAVTFDFDKMQITLRQQP